MMLRNDANKMPLTANEERADLEHLSQEDRRIWLELDKPALIEERNLSKETKESAVADFLRAIRDERKLNVSKILEFNAPDDPVTANVMYKLFQHGDSEITTRLKVFCRAAGIDPQAALQCKEIRVVNTETPASQLKTSWLKTYDLAISLGPEKARKALEAAIKSLSDQNE